MITDLVAHITTQLAKNEVNLRSIRDLEFFILDKTPYLTATEYREYNDKVRLILTPDLTKIGEFHYWRDGAFAVCSSSGKQALAVQEWLGGEERVPINGNMSHCRICQVGRTITLVDKTMNAMAKIQLPDGIDAGSINELVLNDQHFLILNDFNYTSLVDINKGIILAQPNGWDNREKLGENALVKLSRKEGDYLFGYAAKNRNPYTYHPEDATENLPALSLGRIGGKPDKRSLMSRILYRSEPDPWIAGQFVLYNPDFQGRIVTRKELALSRESYIRAIELHKVQDKQQQEKQYVFIAEHETKQIHVYDENLQKITIFNDGVLFSGGFIAASGNGFQGGYIFLRTRKIKKYHGNETYAAEVFDGSLSPLFEMSQCEYKPEKAVVSLNKKDYIVSSPFYGGLVLYDVCGNIAFEWTQGAKDTREFLKGGCIESCEVVKIGNEDFLCIDEYRTYNLSIYDASFSKVSDVHMLGNDFPEICLLRPRNQFNFSAIPLIQCWAHKEKQA